MPSRRNRIDVIMSQPDGCDLHDHCLTCPLPACIFDDPTVAKRIEQQEQIARLRQLASEGTSHARMREEIGVSERTLVRLLHRAGLIRRQQKSDRMRLRFSSCCNRLAA